MGWDGMDGTGRDGTGRDGMDEMDGTGRTGRTGWDGMGWDGMDGRGTELNSDSDSTHSLDFHGRLNSDYSFWSSQIWLTTHESSTALIGTVVFSVSDCLMDHIPDFV